MTKGYRISASTGIHKGDRDYQQDQVTLLSHGRINGCVLAVVADGMGGRSGGRKASDQVMLTSRQLFERFDPSQDDPAKLLEQIVQESHMVIRLTAIASEQEPHSTIAALLILPSGECHWSHAGDSRIYHFHRNELIKRTRDHSYVQALVDRGEITDEEANRHPKSNILLGCLGTERDPPSSTHLIPRLRPGDVFLACSDGLWHYFTDAELAATLDALPPREATEFLIDKARGRARGGGDNLCLAVIKLQALTTLAPAADAAAVPSAP